MPTTSDAPDPPAPWADLTRRLDGAAILGYLNYSDGKPDARFRKALADVFAALREAADPAPWKSAGAWLARRAAELQASGAPAYRDTTQARRVIQTAFAELPAAYRLHHRDLLAHQPDEFLFNAFFLARACEAALARPDDAPAQLVARLNDYVGYRPIAVLETRPQTDYYPHEKVAPVPLYFQGVGVAPGHYADLIRPALELLSQTDRGLLEDAAFDPAKLDELAIDPRAIDHFHPVTKRPSVLFGEWDPQQIDGRGYYRRFVLRQSTFDALLRYVHGEKWPNTTGLANPNPGRLLEAAAALCGTILMGAGVSGSGPSAHDSSVTLSDLVGRIARYRDEFYKRLITQVQGADGDRLREEAARLRQPFASVRQYLNQSIAQERALHLQERRLALLFAAMGYPQAARARTARIPAPATRFGTEIRLRQTEAGNRIAESPDLPARFRLLGEVEDFLNRGIDCGALVDPWNILGYQGLFPIFPGRDDTVRDPRCEDLILTVGRQFDLYAQVLAAAAAGSDRGIEEAVRTRLRAFAAWWDRYATTTVTDLPHVNGQERVEAAEHVAQATALWRTGPANDPAFWRRHRDGFRTAPAFAQVIEALLARGDYPASLALLMTWLSEADAVPLQDPSASFVRLAFRWLRGAVSAGSNLADRPALVRRFFELLEVNADIRWQVPELDAPPNPAREKPGADVAASAFEGVTYRDSADDGNDGAVADGAPPGGKYGGDFALDADAEEREERLRFLAAVARFWRLAALPELWQRADPKATEAVGEWLAGARRNLAALHALIQAVHAVPVPEPTAGLEGVMEFDRRRAVKGSLLELSIQTAVETAGAARSLAALLSRGGDLALPAAGAGGPTAELANWEALAIRVERALLAHDPAGCRRVLPAFVAAFRREPLLVSPPADGGAPTPALRAQTAHSWLESLLQRLPRLGLLRESYQLLKLARQMERNDPPEGRRVSSFDQLFRTAVVGIVDALLAAAKDWGEDASEDGPPAAALRQMADSFRTLWVDHSIGLRLSVLETVLDADDWDDLREFVAEYGRDLFTVRFLSLSNIRGILAQGTANWLAREAEDDGARDSGPPPKLVEATASGAIAPARAARQFELVLQALVEHYDEYRDYNTTTTQSDYGENVYILLDFLRLKVQYERYAWRLRHLVLAHEVLCRRGFDRLAHTWRNFVAQQSGKTADDLLGQLAAKEAEHAVKLRTVRDRLEERFLQLLKIDQAAAKVARAAAAARDGQPEDNPAFAGLLSMIQPLADHPSGVGLDVPAWLRRLEDELRKVRATDPDGEFDWLDQTNTPMLPVSFEELRRQLKEWEKPVE